MTPVWVSPPPMVIAESNSSIMHELSRGVKEIISTGIATKLIESVIVIIVALIFLRVLKGLLRSLERKNVVSTLLSNQIYRLFAIIVYATTFIVIAYIITSISKLIDFAFIIGVVVLISNWKLIADVTAYYLLLAFRGAYQSSLIELPRLGLRGRIVGSTLFYTRLRTPEGRIVYIPNHIMISEPVTQLANVQSTVRVRIEIDTPEGGRTSPVEEAEALIKQALRESKSTTRLQDVVVQVISISGSRMTIMASIPVAGTEPRPATINNIITALYKRLQQLRPSITIMPASGRRAA